MIQVELEVAAIRWVRRHGPPSVIIKRKMYEYLLSYQLFTYNKEDLNTTTQRIYYHPHIFGCWYRKLHHERKVYQFHNLQAAEIKFLPRMKFIK